MPTRNVNTNGFFESAKCSLRTSSISNVMNLLAWQPKPGCGSFRSRSPISHKFPDRPCVSLPQSPAVPVTGHHLREVGSRAVGLPGLAALRELRLA